MGHDATAGEVFAFLHYCALPNKGWPHEEDPLQVICALFAHSANFRHFQHDETETKHKRYRMLKSGNKNTFFDIRPKIGWRQKKIIWSPKHGLMKANVKRWEAND